MSTIQLTRKPLLSIRPETGWAALNLAEAWTFRDLMMTMAGRDLKLRYRQTALGATWVILQPLLAAGILSFIFGKVVGFSTPGEKIPYFLFAYAGQLAWNVFSGTFTRTGSCLVANANLVSKVYFPRLVLPLSTVLSTLIDFGVALVMMAVLMAVYHTPPTWGLLLLPVWLALILLAGLGLGLWASALMVSYRDVQQMIPVLLPFLMYASPVAIKLEKVPQKLLPFFWANPLTGMIEAFRWSLLGTPMPVWSLVYSIVFAVAAFVAGLFAFKRMERRFADVI
jgi:lipopolysaccharide transport system permease protein